MTRQHPPPPPWTVLRMNLRPPTPVVDSRRALLMVRENATTKNKRPARLLGDDPPSACLRNAPPGTPAPLQFGQHPRPEESPPIARRHFDSQCSPTPPQ